MITVETRKAYYEILILLKYLPFRYTKMLPKKMLKLFEMEKIENKEFIIDLKNPINKEFLSKETLAILAMLNYKYWCQDETEKKKLYEIYNLNEEKYQKELIQKYDIEEIFNKRKTSKVIYNGTANTSLIEYKENFFQKIINKIKQIIKITKK